MVFFFHWSNSFRYFASEDEWVWLVPAVVGREVVWTLTSLSLSSTSIASSETGCFLVDFELVAFSWPF